MARKEHVVTQDSPQGTTSGGGLPGFDTSVANAARMWNYWIGGKDNFRADREAAEKVLEAMPALPLIARLVTDPADLAAQDSVLVPQYQELSVLGRPGPGQHRQAAQQTANKQVNDRNDHPAMIPARQPSRA